jgi:hypothetical protein
MAQQEHHRTQQTPQQKIMRVDFFTQSSQEVDFTPEYVSPEQAEQTPWPLKSL